MKQDAQLNVSAKELDGICQVSMLNPLGKVGIKVQDWESPLSSQAMIRQHRGATLSECFAVL